MDKENPFKDARCTKCKKPLTRLDKQDTLYEEWLCYKHGKQTKGFISLLKETK